MRRSFQAAAGVLVLAAAILVPSDPALADGIRSQQWYLNTLKVAQAQAISTGAGITVGLVDTGVDPHPDLKQNLLSGVDEVTGGGNGHNDKVGHGTQMAGLIAAHGRGSSGVLGIAPATKVLPIKIANSEKNFPTTTVVKGIKYAIDHRVNVINVSAGVGPSFELLDALKAAQTANIVVVAATGNEGGTLVSYPAAADGVLAVGATGRNGKHSSFSTTGPQVQICAPGESVETTSSNDTYVRGTGTSEATAIVAGAVALVRAKFPQLSAAEVIHRITATADDNGAPGRDDDCGFGELNIVKALTADVPPLSGATASGPASAPPSAPTVAPTAAASGGVVGAPSVDKKGSSAPLIVGVVVVVLLVAGLVGFVVVRRQRRV
jgi:type VII secretion-associated serine protease mycosin